jgi:serine/threonine-protein kinase
MRAHRRCSSAAALAAVLLVAAPSLAQRSASDKAAAEALFAEGKKLMDAGDFNAACPKLAASEKLDHGIGVLLYLADCYERNGQTASAWATFQEALAEATSAGQAERTEIARVRAATLEAKLVRLTIVVPPAMQAMAGLEVRRDGLVVPAGAYGTAIPVDPGQHLVEVTASGRGKWKQTVAVGPDNPRAEVTLREPAPLPVDAPPPSAAAPPPLAVSTDTAPPRSGGAQRTIGIVTGGVGLAAIAIGGVLGLRAKDQYDQAREECRTESFCSPDGLTGIEDAKTTATVSTIMVASGGGLLAIGVIVFLAAPQPSTRRATGPTLQAKLSYGRATMEGTW